MKRIFLFFSLLFLVSFTAKASDTNGWYIYNGYSSEHSFSVNFPTDWKATIIDDETQGLMPSNQTEPVIILEEFEGQSFDQVINYYSNENLSLADNKDELFQSSTEDLIVKKISFLDINQKLIEKTLFKRGSLIVAFSKTANTHVNTQDLIHSTFKFTDNWHQYIDFINKYTFIFPKSYTFENYDTGVDVIDPNSNQKIFEVNIFEDLFINDAISSLNGSTQINTNTEEILLHNSLSAIKATYRETISGLFFSRIFVENNNDSYSLTDFNIEDNYPHSNYYDDYLVEILESFEFFEAELDDEYFSFLYFTDVRDNHTNVDSINTLFNEEVINGYNDGTFKPDGEINRAELTKMVVAAIIQPNEKTYNNCFSDVEDQWFAPYICYAKDQGWVAGYDDGNFKPESQITRVEAMKIILEANISSGIAEEEFLENNIYSDISDQEWYYKYFAYAENNNLLDKQHVENKNFLPGENISRKEVAEMIFRLQY